MPAACLSPTPFMVRDRLPFLFEDLSDQQLKNITHERLDDAGASCQAVGADQDLALRCRSRGLRTLRSLPQGRSRPRLLRSI